MLAAAPASPLMILCNVLGLVGFYVRDRSVFLAYLLYLPLLPIGVAGGRPGFPGPVAAARHASRPDPDRPGFRALGLLVDAGPGRETAGLGEGRGEPPALERVLGRILEIESDAMEIDGRRHHRARSGHPRPQRGPPLPRMYAGFQRLPGGTVRTLDPNGPRGSRTRTTSTCCAPGRCASESRVGIVNGARRWW